MTSEDSDGGTGDERDLGQLAVAELTQELHAHLDATGSRPIDPTANRWLGEATAVAADVAGGEAPDEAIRKRASQVLDLLDEVGGLADSEAAEHVAAARGIARELVDRLDED